MEESGRWLPLRLVLVVAWVGAWGWGLSLKPSESSGRLKLASPTSSAAGPKWSLYLSPGAGYASRRPAAEGKRRRRGSGRLSASTHTYSTIPAKDAEGRGGGASVWWQGQGLGWWSGDLGWCVCVCVWGGLRARDAGGEDRRDRPRQRGGVAEERDPQDEEGDDWDDGEVDVGRRDHLDEVRVPEPCHSDAADRHQHRAVRHEPSDETAS